MIQNENSNSISSNSPETDEQLMKIQDHLDHREKKLKEMSFMLAELNNDLNTVFFQFFLKIFFYANKTFSKN